MPELPETETIARDLDEEMRGATIIGIHAAHPDVLRHGAFDDHVAKTVGCTIDRVWRRAKLVVLGLRRSHGISAGVIAVQPRFTGALLIDPPLPDAYVCVDWHLADGRNLAYRDVRRLGTVTRLESPAWEALDASLGREPLDASFTAVEFSACVRYSSRSIKAVLMDQRVLAGVGNIYAAEALWAAQIDPSRAASDLSDDACTQLFAALREILPRAIAARGTSFRDYRDARGERGRFVEQLAVYGRAGAPCKRCSTRLVATDAIDGRMTVFCHRCQR
jgi:formamidopyrimidine-DNA glycosylase